MCPEVDECQGSEERKGDHDPMDRGSFGRCAVDNPQTSTILPEDD
jgi:hypothetical protein